MAAELFECGGPEIFAGIATLDLSANVGLTAAQLGRICAGIDAAGVSNGTLTLTGLTPPDAIGMNALTNLLARTWTITCDFAIITQQPKFVVNGDGTWKVTIATHGAGTTYQWQSDLGAEAGKTSATFDNPPVAILGTPRRAYSCVVTRGGVAATSREVMVDVPELDWNSPDVPEANYGQGDLITALPISTSPTDVTFANYAPKGSTYQWRLGGVAIGGATGIIDGGINYAVAAPGPTQANAGSYTVLITTPNGAKKVSSASTIAVQEPFITVQPSYDDGTDTIVELAAVGVAALTYQWYRGDSGDTSSPLDGETNATLAQVIGNYGDANYWVRVTNGNGQVDSVAVTVPTP